MPIRSHAHRLLAGAVLAALLAVGVGAPADTRTVGLDSLHPTAMHRRATGTILELMRRHHYRRVPVDDALSAQMFDRYLDALDPQRIFLLASDVEDFAALRLQLDDALLSEQLEPAFEIFRRYRQRVGERAEFAEALLGREFDFGRDEEYRFNREDVPWAGSEAELDEVWRKRVKNDVLGLRLEGDSGDEIETTLRQRYERMARNVTQLGPNDVFQLFVNAYTQSVEPHTGYFSPRASENFKIRMSLSLEGIGAALQTENEHTVVRRIIAGGPAALSGQLHVDDRIVGVGQGDDSEIVDVVSWRLAEVVDLIRGPKNSVVRLRILPGKAPAGAPTRTISLVRDKINLAEQAAKRSLVEVESGGRQMRIGVIDIPTFYLDAEGRRNDLPDYRSTSRDVRRLLRELQADGVDGVVIDLRGNGGGSLVEAIQLTGLLIDTGPVVQVKDSRGHLRVHDDPEPGVAYPGPVAVLVDRGSASASEIFAAAMQDYRRAVVLGEPTYGKGTVQTLVDLDKKGQHGQLKVTFAQFFRVNGESTQHRGVTPDIVFPTAVDSGEQGERGLDNALPWAEVAPAPHETWSAGGLPVDGGRARHEARMRDDEGFALLLDVLEARRELRARRTVSLLEERRKRERDEQEAGQEEREALYRKAFGADPPDAEDTSDAPDVVLDEAARVLGDLIAISRGG